MAYANNTQREGGGFPDLFERLSSEEYTFPQKPSYPLNDHPLGVVYSLGGFFRDISHLYQTHTIGTTVLIKAGAMQDLR